MLHHHLRHCSYQFLPGFGTDRLFSIRKIAELAQKNLAPNGQLYFEINQYLGKEMMDLLEEKGFQQMELRKDIYGNHRMVFGRK